MPNLEILLDNIAQIIEADDTRHNFFFNLDLRYVYSQILQDKETKDQGNFRVIGGKATGTYQF